MVKRAALAGAIVVTTALAFALDFWTSAELIGAILFTLPLALCAVQGSKKLLWVVAAAAVVLTIAAEFWGVARPPLANPLVSTINRALLIAALLILAAFIHLRIGIENTLRATEDRFRLLVGSVSDYAIFMLDPKGMVTSWNKGAERIKGYRADEILGQHFSKFYCEADARAGKCEAELRTASASGRAEDEGWRLRKDGTQFWANVVISAVIDPLTGKLLGFSKVTRDLTERKKAEHKFRDLLEAAPDAMVIADSAGRMVLVNAQAEKLFGYTRDEMLEQSVELLVPDRFRTEHPAPGGIYVGDPRTRHVSSDVELFAVRKDGSEFPIEMSSSPLQTEDGPLTSSAIRDITARKQTETALVLANRELEAFSYSVAHDLRAPLRGMNGFAQVLLDTYKNKLDAEGQDWLQEILINATKMGSLINALLSLGRVTRTELNPVSVDFSAVARAAATELGAGDPQRSVEVVIADNLCAELDPHLARVLADNLLGNAWKFTAHTTAARIEVGETTSNAGREFFVRDNGAGFDMEFADKLFVPFQRLHTSSEFAGTGVGLATVQRIIHRHGGRIWAEGTVSQGATFHFNVPAHSHTRAT